MGVLFLFEIDQDGCVTAQRLILNKNVGTELN